MAIITSTLILSTLSIFHLTIAYTLLTNPGNIAEQNLVFILGSSLRLPKVSSALPSALAHPASSNFSTPGTPAHGLAALFLSFLALSDLTALSMQDDIRVIYWTAQAPTRLFALFAFEAWIYLTRPAIGAALGGSFDGLKTDVAFTWAFLELLVLMWAFTKLKDEKKQIAFAKARDAKAAEQD